MDQQRFDTFTRSLAQRLTRRTAIGRLAGGGAAGALTMGAFQAAGRPTAAQQTTPTATEAEAQVCIFPFEAKVRSGPNAGQGYSGYLALALGADGSIDRGSLVGDDGTEVAVVGQATGRAISLLCTVGDGRFLYGTGVAGQNVAAACSAGEQGLYADNTPLGGPFVGPQEGDVGDWAACCCPRPGNNFNCGVRSECDFCPDPSSSGGGGGGGIQQYTISCSNVTGVGTVCDTVCTPIGPLQG